LNSLVFVIIVYFFLYKLSTGICNKAGLVICMELQQKQNQYVITIIIHMLLLV